MRNEIQSTFSTSKSKNVRTAKRKKKKGGGGRKRKAGDSRERNLTNVFDRWTDGFSCEFSWSAIKGRFSSARLAPLLPDGGGRLFLRSALKGNITNSAALRPRRNASGGAIHPYRVTDFSRGITRGYRIVPRIHESAIVSIFPSIPSPLLSPLCAFVSSKCFLIFLARASACIMELVSEKFPRMFFFSPLLDFIFLLLPFFFSFSTMFAIVISRNGEEKRSLLLFFANIIVRDTFFFGNRLEKL